MKRFLSILVFLMAIVPFALAQEQAKETAKSQEEVKSGPVMEFEAMEINYGDIEQNADPYRVFKFKNVGTEPLVIKQAKGSCGCTVPTYPTEPILQGETAEIKVRYDTRRIGAFSKTVTLTTNGNPESVVLTIKGNVKKPAEQQGLPAGDKNMFNNSNQ